MDTLHDQLAELADDAPTGGAPPAELWARGKRAHRLRATALAATLLVVGAVGTGIGVRLADGGDNRSGPAPAGPDQSQIEVGFALPIEYPVGEELPDLGDTPGPLAAIWLAPRMGGGAPEAVGLVAETGTFGTLPIDVPGNEFAAANPGIALSPDGRRIAYLNTDRPVGDVAPDPNDELVVHDLVSGEKESPTIEDKVLAPFAWIDATHLVGHAYSSSGGIGDTDGWVWEPGTAPKLVDLGAYPGQPYLGYGWPYGGKDLLIPPGPRLCVSPRLGEVSTEEPGQRTFEVPVLCDVLGVVGSAILLGHWNSGHSPSDSTDPKYAKGTVVALDIDGADRPYLDPARPRGPDADHAFEDPARRHVVVTAGAPHRVEFATDLIGEALEAAGGAS